MRSFFQLLAFIGITVCAMFEAGVIATVLTGRVAMASSTGSGTTSGSASKGGSNICLNCCTCSGPAGTGCSWRNLGNNSSRTRNCNCKCRAGQRSSWLCKK